MRPPELKPKPNDNQLLTQFFNRTVFVYALPLIGALIGYLLAYWGPWDATTGLKLIRGGALLGCFIGIGIIIRNMIKGPPQ